MVSRATIELINSITEEKAQFLDQDWHGLNPAEEKRLKAFGLFDMAEVKDCIVWYTLTNAEKYLIDYEKQKLANMQKRKTKR
jgi:hypothetical protein